MKDYNQFLFDELFRVLSEKGYKVFDYLPPEETDYPFIHLGEITIYPMARKDIWHARAVATIDIWNDGANRIEVSKIIQDIFKIGKQIKHFHIAPNESDYRILKDTTTNNELWHGIVNLVYYFY